MANKIDWIIKYSQNGVACACCGKTETSYHELLGNAYTQGMSKYGHMEFQLVLAYSGKELCRILNTFGLWVQEGRRFTPGEYVSGIFEDCNVRLMPFIVDGTTMLRVIVPDKNNIFPEDPKCLYPYNMQLLPTDALSTNGGACH